MKGAASRSAPRIWTENKARAAGGLPKAGCRQEASSGGHPLLSRRGNLSALPHTQAA
jgi:hypothetical protein